MSELRLPPIPLAWLAVPARHYCTVDDDGYCDECGQVWPECTVDTGDESLMEECDG